VTGVVTGANHKHAADQLIVSASATSLPTSPRALRNAIFDAINPEQVARSLPAQALYLLVRDAGVTSSLDLLALADVEQFRTMLDLDLWRGDEVSEESFWEWLSLVEEADDFSILQRVLKTIDLKLVGMMLGTYVQVITYDDGNDEAPGAGFYTPDRGHTWLHITIQEPDKHFLLARFLALIFETSRELFYQLLSVPTVATRTQLEEEAYQDRNKRLEAHGVPAIDFAHEILASLPFAQLSALIDKHETGIVIPDVRPVPVLHHTVGSIEPLDSVFRAALSGVEEEYTLLANGMIVKFGVDFADRDGVQRVTTQLLGAINIGHQRTLRERNNLDALELVKLKGLRPFARYGLTALDALRRTALRLSEETLKRVDPNSGLFLTIAAAREHPPLIPSSLNPDGSYYSEAGRIERDYRAIKSLIELEQLTAIIKSVDAG
jgi:hypothetical protein